MEERIEYLCHKIGVPITMLRSSKRDGKLVKARRMIATILRPRYTLSKIGEGINRDHTSVMNLLEKHESEMIHEDYRVPFKKCKDAYQLYFDELETEMPIETYLNKQCILLDRMVSELREIRQELKEARKDRKFQL